MSNVRNLGVGVIIHSHGNEDFNVVMNGIARTEMQRKIARDVAAMEIERKKFEKYMELMNMFRKQRDDLRDQRLKENYVKDQVKPCEQIRESIGFVLACLICWLEELKWIEHIDDEDMWR